MRKSDREIIEVLHKLGLKFKFFVGQEVVRISTQEVGTITWISPKRWWLGWAREGYSSKFYLERNFVRPRYLKDVRVR